MKKSELAKLLATYSGNTYKFENNTVTITGFTFDETTFTLYTDKENIVGIRADVEKTLDKLIPIQVVPYEKSPAKPTKQTQLLPEATSNLFSELTNIAQENIKRVQKNKDYVEQATEVRNNLNTMIELIKTEVNFRKTLQS